MTDTFVFNGIDAGTGTYLLPEWEAQDLVTIAKGVPLDPDRLNELRTKAERLKQGGTLGPIEGVDAKKLEESGWGIIFPGTMDVATVTHIKDALKPLLDLRREQATKNKEHYYKEFTGFEGYHAGQTKREWLADRGVAAGPVDPNRGVPYYLLIAGDPEQVPYEFQYDLDVQFATGRIYFSKEDGSPDLEKYANYARSVVAVETGKVALPRQLTFFAVQNDNDRATKLSMDELIKPLTATLPGKWGGDWNISTVLQASATKTRLAQLLGGNETPSLLFTASHGAGFKKDHKLQLRHQGALICQDWPGPEQWRAALDPDKHYFSSDDLSDETNLLGLIAFFFACFGAGTPLLDDFAHQLSLSANPEPIASRPFIASLPQRMLSLPKGGALAVVGHVERATGYSISWPNAPQQTQAFESMLERLKGGHPIGSAVEFLNERYAELAAELSSIQTDLKRGRQLDPVDVSRVWTASNDARGYVIIGDPAVRLVQQLAAQPQRPPFESPAVIEFTPTSGVLTPETAGSPQPSTAGNSAANEQTSTTLGVPKSAQPLSAAASSGPDLQSTSFGWLWGSDGNDNETSQKLKQSFQELAGKLGAKIEEFVRDVTSLEVKTYVAPDINQALQGAQPDEGGAILRASTRISFDGDIQTILPMSEIDLSSAIDADLWKIHTDMVDQAKNARTEMLKAILDAIGGLLNIKS